MAQETRKPRSAHVTVRIDPTHKTLIKSCADHAKVSVSEWLRWAVERIAEQEYPELYYTQEAEARNEARL